MSGNESIIRTLLGSTEFTDPRLYDLIDKMLVDFYKVYYSLYPPTTGRAFSPTGSGVIVNSVTGFSVSVGQTNIHLSWSAVSGAVSYEIRYHSGTYTDWDTSEVLLVTTTLAADIDPVTLPMLYGSHTFMIKATNLAGVVSTAAALAVATLSTIPAPVVTSIVIDNFVLLKWTVPSSALAVAYYNVYKDSVFSGKLNGTFKTIFETVSGTFTYQIEAVDVAGNVGALASCVVSVNQPPDYELQDDRISDLSGTLSKCVVEGNKLVAIVKIC